MMNRNNKPLLILLLILFIIFVFIPFVVSISYGNVPFYNRFPLNTQDILVTNNKNLDQEHQLSFLYNNTYTWDEVTRYVVRSQMTFFRVFRINLIISGIVILSIIADRTFIRGSGFKRK
ncbi:ABC-type sugar transport system permease subunit [Natronobacillus azotifigens]|uniref:Uncharacterized protein n=1 Tax=Natronobacillus azotifigens TaxID=472978 RepID=A0A9J6R9J9_9BACI|nr:hypothetical protein [Natronobacillus azotifigens]MCZ0701945.1 hypothetical protein [Natronobacillus azotifigens]